ncbi:MAG: hypothetical protein ABIQ33_06045 [Caldimonas sp.]
MSDNIFSAILTFSLLAAGTAAVGNEMMAPRSAVKAAAGCSLPAVTVTGKRIAAAAATVTLPTVVVTGRRQAVTEVAVDDTGRESRVQ